MIVLESYIRNRANGSQILGRMRRGSSIVLESYIRNRANGDFFGELYQEQSERYTYDRSHVKREFVNGFVGCVDFCLLFITFFAD